MSAADNWSTERSFPAFSAATATPLSERDPRILVVEDDSAAAIDLCIRLPRMGYNVVGHASTGSEALSLAARRPPELVLIDIRIPGDSDGVETARRLFERFDVGIIYLTDHRDDRTLARANGAAHPYSFLPKPIRGNELRLTLEEAVRKRRHAHELCTGLDIGKAQGPTGGPADQYQGPPTAELTLINERLGALTLQLQHALHTKDSFVADMSHELRTPLASILGYTDVLLMGLSGGLNSDQERHLRIIQRSGEHLLSLINDLLDLAKLNAGPLELRAEPVRCQSVVEETIATAAPLATAKHLTLTAHPAEPGLAVFGDRRAVQQILLNLIGNAIKFTQRGEVSVTCRRTIEGGRHYVSWEVRDTGPGIKPDDLKHLFRPFERLELRAQPAQPGSGLGLHLSQRLAQQMHGSIRVESVVEVGSVFTLVLPASIPDDGYT